MRKTAKGAHLLSDSSTVATALCSPELGGFWVPLLGEDEHHLVELGSPESCSEEQSIKLLHFEEEEEEVGELPFLRELMDGGFGRRRRRWRVISGVRVPQGSSLFFSLFLLMWKRVGVLQRFFVGHFYFGFSLLFFIVPYQKTYVNI